MNSWIVLLCSDPCVKWFILQQKAPRPPQVRNVISQLRFALFRSLRKGLGKKGESHPAGKTPSKKRELLPKPQKHLLVKPSSHLWTLHKNEFSFNAFFHDIIQHGKNGLLCLTFNEIMGFEDASVDQKSLYRLY